MLIAQEEWNFRTAKFSVDSPFLFAAWKSRGYNVFD